MSDNSPRAVISEDYRRQQAQLHQNPDYGTASLHLAPLVARVVRNLKAGSLSDYGAGKQNLRRGLEAEGVSVDYRPYDPAFPEYGPPRPADLVCCIDVLEHVEPDCLDAVLDELQALTERYALFTVHTGPAIKVLEDGRNAHLIQQPTSWWLPRICSRFELESFQKDQHGFLVVVSPIRAGGAASHPSPTSA